MASIFKKGQGGGTLPSSVVQSTFYGTLRSELDEPEDLPAPFVAVLENFGAIHQRYLSYDMTEEEFGAALKTLVFVDLEGYSWTIGASSSRWYRRAPGDDRWAPASPDRAVLS